MTLYRHIVVGTDFSANAEKALNEGIYLTLKYGARLSILHIIDERFHNYREVLPLPPSEMEQLLLQETRRKLSERLEHIEIDTVSYEAHVLFGFPHEEIIRYAREEDADLILIGQKNLPLLKHIFLGSTAERLLRHTPIPLMIVHYQRQIGHYKNILVPVDFSKTSENAVNYAISLAEKEGSKLYILHVCEENPLLSLSGLLSLSEEKGILSTYEERQKNELDNFVSKFDYPNLEPIISSGVPALEIVRWSEELSCDLIVMGTLGKTGVRGMLLGNTTERVARALPCSLLAVTSDIWKG